MLLVTYTLSPFLEDNLEKIDEIRKDLLLTPISLKIDLGLRWEAMLERIYWYLSLDGNPVPRSEIRRLLTLQNIQKNLTPQQREVIDYKKAIHYISQNWLSSPEKITSKVILKLYNTTYFPTFGPPTDFAPVEESIQAFLVYLQQGKDHPVIASATAFIQLLHIGCFHAANERMARLLVYLFLYKYYYDFRGLLVLERDFRQNLSKYRNTYQAVLQTKNLTSWLEFFSESLHNSLEKVQENLKLLPFQVETTKPFWQLNNRQKEILTLLENPQETIANKKVQQILQVSQITASRDLAKLATLGFLFTHGKGRSVYYTKV